MEMQFDAFSYPALDQVISHVAKYRYRSRQRAGPLGHPDPLRRRHRGGRAPQRVARDLLRPHRGAEGRRALHPLDAYSLLRQSIADPDPVVFLEPKSRYWSKETGDLQANGTPIGRARVVRAGGTPR